MAYSITQGRCCTALQFYSSLFCITFLPSRVSHVVTTFICNLNFIVIDIGFTLYGCVERIRSEFQRSRGPCVVFVFANAFFRPNDRFISFLIPGSESGFLPRLSSPSSVYPVTRLFNLSVTCFIGFAIWWWI